MTIALIVVGYVVLTVLFALLLGRMCADRDSHPYPEGE